MTLRLMACLAAAVLLGSHPGLAQSTADRISLRSCSIVGNEVDRQYAAAVGVMSLDDSVYSTLLKHFPTVRDRANRTTPENCASRVAEEFCRPEVFENLVVLITNSMAGGGAGRFFFGSLDLAETTEDPAGNAIGLTLGAAGALTGLMLGKGEGSFGRLGDAAKWGAGGFLLGTAIGAYRITDEALDTCRSRQAAFDSLTDRLLANGFRPQRHTAYLYGEIERVVTRMPAADQEVAREMIEAMAAVAAMVVE